MNKAMPIAREHRWLYPIDWRELSDLVRFTRAKGRCEHCRRPQSNGISEAFVHTLKRDYVRVSPLPDALTALTSLAGWIEDYNDNHPHSGLKMRSPREHRALVSATA